MKKIILLLLTVLTIVSCKDFEGEFTLVKNGTLLNLQEDESVTVYDGKDTLEYALEDTYDYVFYRRIEPGTEVNLYRTESELVITTFDMSQIQGLKDFVGEITMASYTSAVLAFVLIALAISYVNYTIKVMPVRFLGSLLLIIIFCIVISPDDLKNVCEGTVIENNDGIVRIEQKKLHTSF